MNAVIILLLFSIIGLSDVHYASKKDNLNSYLNN